MLYLVASITEVSCRSFIVCTFFFFVAESITCHPFAPLEEANLNKVVKSRKLSSRYTCLPEMKLCLGLLVGVLLEVLCNN